MNSACPSAPAVSAHRRSFTVIESDWPLEEPDWYADIDGHGKWDDDEAADPLDDCFLPDDFDEALPEPGDFWLDDPHDDEW